MYSSQNLSPLAIRYLSEVINHNPKHHKAIFLKAREHYKLNEPDTAKDLVDKGYSICLELGNTEYIHLFSILNCLISNVSGEDLEKTALEGISYFESESLYEYVEDSQEYLAVKFYEERNHIKSSEYFYLATKTRQKIKERESLK